MELDFNHTIVFDKNKDANTRVVVNEGGTRSSKTYSIAQLFIYRALTEHNKVFTIARKTMPALRGTAMKDVLDILKQNNIYSEQYHNKSQSIITIKSNEIAFISSDEPQKIRGRKQNYLWLNEANELTIDDWRQFSMRTTQQIFLDYNPSDEYSWIYDIVLPRPDVTLIHSTYKDNPFLEKEVVNEIEMLKDSDLNYWRVFGLGLRGTSIAAVYTGWTTYDTITGVDDYCFGLDFGFNNPMALIWCGVKDKKWYCEQKIYETKLTIPDLLSKFKLLDVSKTKEIWADSAGAEAIEQIRRAGYNIKPADKSVLDGIRAVKSQPLSICKYSGDVLKEIKNYKFKEDKTGKILDDVVKFNDHALDAIRYAIFNHTFKTKILKPAQFTFANR